MTPSGTSPGAAPEGTRVTRLGPGSLLSGWGLLLAPEEAGPLALRGPAADRPVHAWDGEAEGEQVTGSCRSPNATHKGWTKAGTGSRACWHRARTRQRSWDLLPTQMWRRGLRLKDSCYQRAVAGCLGPAAGGIRGAGAASKTVRTDWRGQSGSARTRHSSVHSDDPCTSRESCATCRADFRQPGVVQDIEAVGLFPPPRKGLSLCACLHEGREGRRGEEGTSIQTSGGWQGQGRGGGRRGGVAPLLRRCRPAFTMPAEALAHSHPGPPGLGPHHLQKATTPSLTSSVPSALPCRRLQPTRNWEPKLPI